MKPAPDASRGTDLLRRSAVWHATLVAIAAIPLAISNKSHIFAGLALGAFLMFANVAMLTRALARAFLATSEPPQPTNRTLGWIVRWPLLALALVGILWYMPARLEGVLAGITISLASTVIAALRLSANESNHG